METLRVFKYLQKKGAALSLKYIQSLFIFTRKWVTNKAQHALKILQYLSFHNFLPFSKLKLISGQLLLILSVIIFPKKHKDS